MMARLPEAPTQRIDRDREIAFTYKGKPMKGFVGDTIATALYANGVRIFSRSMKYHRPRGLYNLDGYSSNCLMGVDGEPNVRACRTPLRQGMAVKPQNVLGTPEWDLMSVMQWFGFAMPAGFYYKVFHKPAWLWRFVEPVIRRAAGFGSVDPEMPDGIYENRYLNAEVCVIGGGPAGMRAALEAAKAGVRVLLLETNDRLGGALNYRTVPVNGGVPAFRHAAILADEVRAFENIRVLLSTSATAIYQSNQVTAVQKGGPAEHFRECYYEIRAKSIVAATGAIERPLIFQNNDMPGIMQGSCALQLARTYGVKPGSRAVFSGFHDGMLEVAADLAELGVEIAAVADGRTGGFDAAAIDRLKRLGIPFYPGYAVARACGFRSVSKVALQPVRGGSALRFDCDLVVASAGETPLSQILQVAGAQMAYNANSGCFLPVFLPPGIHAAGRVAGHDGVAAIEAQGRLAALSALRDAGVEVSGELKAAGEALESLSEPKQGPGIFQVPGKGHKRFVCFDEDVTVEQVASAMGEGFDQAELVKRYTTAGTGPSQSYLAGQNLPLVVGALKGLEPGAVMPTTVRPPIFPTSMAVLGGRRHAPVKRTPLHDRQKAMGGALRLAGVWERARFFENARAVSEIENVRGNVGFIDVSTLGKFRLFGSDALRLLQRVYAGDMSKVTRGKLKYAAMCNEQGIIIDDGVVTQMDENDYFFTTSSVRAANTGEWLSFHSRGENWQTSLVNLTDAMAGINLAGPRSREVLSQLTDADLSNAALPYMGIRRVKLCGEVEGLVMRVGFVGELSFEVHVPSSYGLTFHDALLEAGKPFGIKPFGMEAQSVLRLEKGHVIIGLETDNHSTLHDIGMSWAWDRQKTDAKTVGAPALRAAEKQAHRQKLVGFMMRNAEETPSDGSIVVAGGEVKGRICSSRYSTTLGKSIGMALVDPELAVMGGALEIYTDGKLVKRGMPPLATVEAEIVPTPFYDPQGLCMKG
ncbi:MAG: 2Fe-2S iron-sulfur cluster-binding protein [Syntrophobacteraceae bacterium]